MIIYKRFVVNILASSYLLPSKVRMKLYRTMGMDINASGIRAKCFFNSKFVKIGRNSSINYFCQFHSSYSPSGYIEIGENCFLGMNVTLCTITHKLGEANKRAGENEYRPIVVKDGCWIGANSIILPGVSIGNGCVIAAGTVVNKDCAPNGLYAGVPAKRVKDLPV